MVIFRIFSEGVMSQEARAKSQEARGKRQEARGKVNLLTTNY